MLQALFFGFTIGIGVTQVVFLGSPPPFGYGLSPDSISGLYATPLVSHFQYRIQGITDLQYQLQIGIIIGELIGRYLNDWIMNVSIRRNKGVFEAESRLWCVDLAFPTYTFSRGILCIGHVTLH
jgi:hypothetical protein